MSTEPVVSPPKIFISYRWTSPQHEEWVLALATSLRTQGVDVILDKWHLSEGQDTLAFMESVVNDPSVQKVLMICDQGYVRRANNREGGVGTEAQIISAKVYESVDQNKFAAIVVDLDADGRPFLPHYMSTRLYFDLSNPDAETINFEKIVRWIFGKPFHSTPPIGEPPKYLDETHLSVLRPALSSERLRQAKGGGSGALAAAGDVLSEIGTNAKSLILDSVNDPNADETIYEGIKATFPLLEDTHRAFLEVLRSGDPKAVDIVNKFFEAMLTHWDYTPLNRGYSRWDNDVLHYFGHACFVGFVALGLQERAFAIVADVLSMPLYKPRPHERTGESASYADFRPYLEGLESRNKRLGLSRLSIHADMLEENHQHSLVTFGSFLEADLTLYVRGILSPKYNWYPISGVFLGRSFGALPTYVRATSMRFYNRLKPVLMDMEPDTFRARVTASLADSNGLRFDYREVSVAQLINLESLGTTA